MIKILLLLTITIIAGCTSSHKSPAEQVANFYNFYLNTPNTFDSSVSLQPYLEKQTFDQLQKIAKEPEPDTLDADYFTQSQDIGSSWPTYVAVSAPTPAIGGTTVEVTLGAANDIQQHLILWLVWQDGWKITRVQGANEQFLYR